MRLRGLIVAPRRGCPVSRVLRSEEGGVNNHDTKLSLHEKPERRRLATFCEDFPSTRSDR